MINNRDRILVVLAHPDDEILMCGGMIARYANSCMIRVLFVAEGESCRFSDPRSNATLQSLIERRKQSASAALRLLGVRDVYHLDYHCGRLDEVAIIEINKSIEMHITEFQPTHIFTHSARDVNNDHKVVARSIEMSSRPIFKHSINIFSGEVLSSSEWAMGQKFNPNFYIALSEAHLELKVEALKCYESELRNFPHSRSEQAVYALARYRGIANGFPAAEAFQLLRGAI